MVVETPFIITTNMSSRSERAGDREILIVFNVPSASKEEISAAEKKVKIDCLVKMMALREAVSTLKLFS